MGALATHRGTWSVDDRLAAPWHYLPVEVPAGAAALRVTLSAAGRAARAARSWFPSSGRRQGTWPGR
jgi:hypothetical protein